MKFKLLIFIIFVCGCATTPPIEENLIGSRTRDGEKQAFATREELFISGLVDEGLSYASRNRNQDAEIKLRQALYLSPGNEQIRFNLAVVLFQSGQLEESEAILLDLISKSDKNIDYLAALGQAYILNRKFDEARDIFKLGYRLTRDANNFRRASILARSVAIANYEAGHEAEALCYSYEAYALSPAPLVEMAKHVRLLLALNLYQTVKDLVEDRFKAEKILGTSPSVFHGLALAKFALGDEEGAKEAEERALDYIKKEPESSAEVNSAYFILKYPDGIVPEDVSDFEKTESEDRKISTIEFGLTPSNAALLYWPPGLIQRLQNLVEANQET